ncbi:MAG TPA: hypothetical protein QGG47_07630 [Acidobacteriota bacterium]|nr:hypothetical protein [Acidobacteriota bacterium]
MTTAAEVKQLVTDYPEAAQRVVFLSALLLTSDEGLDAIAREMVALANRDGGRGGAARARSQRSVDPQRG